ncbi:hypothetical protein [Flavobacterium columnare]|uniref:hypothetical protein n=1 Tax=Flavobacterium columnare TaxID=996 RepID=UPI001F0898F7|nr:hypothetical protein [Flavobacterium columnare]
MEEKINDYVLVSTKNYQNIGMNGTKKFRIILTLNRPIQDQAYLETEVFKSFFGEDLGKKEFFFRSGFVWQYY